MRKRRHLGFIIHGARADLPAVRHLVSWVREKGHTVRPRVTWEAGDGADLTRDLIAAGVDTVVACGGDGTVNEVLNGLRGSDVPLGIIPIGTANDFAKQTGIPDDADHAMDVVLRRRPMRIDTASLNGRRFLNVSSGGIGAEATAETPAEAKETLGPLAYFLTGLRKLAELEPRRGRFQVGDVRLDVDFLLFAVANARATGGGTLIAPRAKVQDGLLDVVIVEHMPRRDFARLVLRLKKGEHLEEDGVHYLQLPRLDIETETPVTVNVDGEPQELSRLAYESHRGDLLVHLPHLPEEPDDDEEIAIA